MILSAIQHRDTRELIMFFKNGIRISKREYYNIKSDPLLMKNYNSAHTIITRSGNYKHTFSI